MLKKTVFSSYINDGLRYAERTKNNFADVSERDVQIEFRWHSVRNSFCKSCQTIVLRALNASQIICWHHWCEKSHLSSWSVKRTKNIKTNAVPKVPKKKSWIIRIEIEQLELVHVGVVEKVYRTDARFFFFFSFYRKIEQLHAIVKYFLLSF